MHLPFGNVGCAMPAGASLAALVSELGIIDMCSTVDDCVLLTTSVVWCDAVVACYRRCNAIHGHNFVALPGWCLISQLLDTSAAADRKRSG